MSPSKILSIAALTAAVTLTPVAANAADAPTVRPAAAVHHPVAKPKPKPKPRPKPQPVLVVRAGQRVNLGHGAWMTLTHTERCVTSGTASTCKSVTDGNQPAGTVSLQSSGDSARTFYSPLYIGAGSAARMTVQEGGRIYQVRVVTLAGHPGYATGYAWGAPVPQPVGGPSSWPKVTVYDASGRVLAQL